MSNEVRARNVQHYVRKCADIIGLKDWEIVYNPSGVPDGEDTLAEIYIAEMQTAELYLAVAFWDLHPEKKRRVVAHELGHLHTALLHETAAWVPLHFPLPTGALLFSQLELIEEQLAERIARLVCDRLPLPAF